MGSDQVTVPVELLDPSNAAWRSSDAYELFVTRVGWPLSPRLPYVEARAVWASQNGLTDEQALRLIEEENSDG